MEKSLDRKIARILADRSCKDFILADAKDGDMAYGLSAPGRSPEHHAAEARFRTLDEYRQLMREIVGQGLVDIMLMSASSSEVLTIQERLFDDSPVTPAVRANDTTDIWLAAGSGRYPAQPSRPFRTATIDHIMCGKAECPPDQRRLGADLGLYSVTFNNDTERDRETLEAYRTFRLEAEAKGFRHFLEVFDPNACSGHCPEDLPRFINDHIARALAGVTLRGRPLFLKIPYHGPAAMEALAGYDRSLVVGVLGGSSGTTYDAFHMLWEAKKHGARAALYGRKINNSEHQLTFVKHLRAIADDQIGPEEAVRAYHGDLERLGIRPYRSLQDDLQRTAAATSYGGSAPPPRVAARSTQPSSRPPEEPDFSKMTPAEKARWNLERWKQILG
ncbi:MAG: beta/alpha barrel domain-containing protein [Planctomycetota bacterium]|jgi:hypothetical protein